VTPLLRFFRFSLYGLGVIALVLSLAADGDAQSNEWLIGVWSSEGGIGALASRGTYTFRNEGGVLKWATTFEGRNFKMAAEGVVVSSDASSAELTGKYTSATNQEYVGSGVKVSLKGSPSALTGSGISEYGNRAWTMTLTKNK